MPDDKSITMEICEFLDNCPLDGFIEKLYKSEIYVADTAHIDETIAKIKLTEGKMRKLRQQIEYHVRKHRLEVFREMV
jgi:hypothetical protein